MARSSVLSLTVATELIFNQHRLRVDLFLRQHAPTVFDQFAAAYRRVQEGVVEERAQALPSCSRILKTVADTVYPVTAAPVTGRDGKTRVLSDDQYVNRLLQFISGGLGGRPWLSRSLPPWTILEAGCMP